MPLMKLRNHEVVNLPDIAVVPQLYEVAAKRQSLDPPQWCPMQTIVVMPGLVTLLRHQSQHIPVLDLNDLSTIPIETRTFLRGHVDRLRRFAVRLPRRSRPN